MHFIDVRRCLGRRATVGAVALLLMAGGCSVSRPPPAPVAAREPPSAAPPPPQRVEPTTATVVPAAPRVGAAPALPAARRARNWDDFQVIAAQRLLAANASTSYAGTVHEPLLAIPVLEIELNGDGSVRRIVVKRHPRQALDTVDLAIAAVHRAAPFGDVSHLPRPWKFTEVFLFDDARRFKPRTLDL